MVTKKYTRHPHYPDIRISKKEKWKAVPGYEGLYEVSTWGRVKSMPRFKKIRGGGLQPIGGKLRTPSPKNDGRLLVLLWKKNKVQGFQIHRLVLLAFVGPCPNGMEACHFPDPKPTNNRLENLRWDTHKNNFADDRTGENHKMAKLTVTDVRQIKKLIEEGETNTNLGRRFGVDRTTIGLIRKNINWRNVNV